MKISTPFFFVALLCLFACDDDETTITDNIPVIAYSSVLYEGEFNVPSATPEPNIIWLGSQGNIELSGNPSAVSLNSETGVISWDNTLPLGENSFQSIIRNPAGESKADITINNLFKGRFEGGFNTNPSSQTLTNTGFSIEFNGDGTFSVIFNNGATGTYVINGSQITADYTYSNGDMFSFDGTIVINGAEAFISGNWFEGHGTIQSEISGFFRVDHVLPMN